VPVRPVEIIDDTASCERVDQLNHASTTQITENARATDTDTTVIGLNNISNTGVKMSPAASSAPVMVYWTPVCFSAVSNTATSSVNEFA